MQLCSNNRTNFYIINNDFDYNFKIFLGAMPSDLLNISMLHKLIVLHRITHNHSYTMKIHFDYMPNHRFLAMPR